jgi:hypothetical protein
MPLQRKTKSILALIVSSVFFFQNCATTIRGTSQKIPVTSSPSGAKITVDGEEMGYAPLNLKLKRKKSHVIRIEKQGYNPLEIRTTRKTSAGLSVFANIFWGGLGFCGGFLLAVVISDGELPSPVTAPAIIGGTILAWGGAITIDFLGGANYALSPTELNVTLSKIEGKSQPKIILIDTEHFQNIKWIRIKCTDSGREEIVNLD